MSHGLLINLKKLNNKKILITGATGFIGGRVVERLCNDTNAKVYALCHNLSRAIRIAKFQINLVGGDVLNKNNILKVTRGMDYVIHCAYGSTANIELNKKITVGGTRNIVNACKKNKVKKLIYLSTVSVYGYPLHGKINENFPYKKVDGDFYNNHKIIAEKLVAKSIRQGLPAVILQPPVVYGPYGYMWTVSVVEQLKNNELFLINNGLGIANPVYVDNVVDAILLALTKEKALGEKIIISDGKGITWRQFFSYYQKMLPSKLYLYDKSRRIKISILFALASSLRKIKNRIIPIQIFKSDESLIRKLVNRSITQGGVVKSIEKDKNLHSFFMSKAFFDITKAAKILGYKPRTNLRTGMDFTNKWLNYQKIYQSE